VSDQPKDPRDTTGQPTQAITTVASGPPIALSLETVQGFEALQRAARLFASSDLVPKDYKNNIPNCTIALTVALRMKADPLMVFQNLNIIHGKPGWSSAFLIASVNTGGRFSPLRFEFVGTPGKDDWGCRAYATDLRSKERLDGTTITIDMAKREGWVGRAGSKWLTMPEQMLRYRAASWWIRTYAPEMSMGFLTRDEIEDAGLDVAASAHGAMEAHDAMLKRMNEPGQKEAVQAAFAATPQAMGEAAVKAANAVIETPRTPPQASPEPPPPAKTGRGKKTPETIAAVRQRLAEAGVIPPEPVQQPSLALEDEPEPGTDG
jgi:hypothetical protein